MNVKQIISAEDYKIRKVFHKEGGNYLNISEFYYDTIQGEGIYLGHPAAFIRLQNCTMNCSYCDTTEVWRYGSPYSFYEINELMLAHDILYQLKHGQHLVFTGGSPLLQQDKIKKFLIMFNKTFNFLPFVEIENECTLLPSDNLIPFVNCWNNSPKLAESGVPIEIRYREQIIKKLAGLQNSWFKFVVSIEDEWDEIDNYYLFNKLIKKEQIILMPLGTTRIELESNREAVLKIAVEQGVRYCSREHIVLWDKRIGV
jgi:organic radical activating enzyme